MSKDKEEQNEEKSSPLSCFKNISFPFNTIFLIANSIFLATSAFWFVTFSMLHYKTDECNRFVTTPGIFVSFSLLFMTLAGFYAAYYKSDCLFRIHFFIFFLWMFVVVAKTVFIYRLNNETNPRLYPGTKIHEFRLEDYSGWVRRLVIKDDEWYRTRRCLVKDNVCNKLFSNQNMSASEFRQMNLTPIQIFRESLSGLCSNMSGRKETVLDLAKFVDKGVQVKLTGGRQDLEGEHIEDYLRHHIEKLALKFQWPVLRPVWQMYVRV
ncbi:hypothetical protein F2Q69_00024395 [Brassica cretica]|uniref:Uncharacterized protein n=1 Tax=Brassica cretica TaxID=69181 RepID=A0A8S9QLY5_BRACR|nr:hypothetical protein F2Q69_00024395 [Brassica cretica]